MGNLQTFGGLGANPIRRITDGFFLAVMGAFETSSLSDVRASSKLVLHIWFRVSQKFNHLKVLRILYWVIQAEISLNLFGEPADFWRIG